MIKNEDKEYHGELSTGGIVEKNFHAILAHSIPLICGTCNITLHCNISCCNICNMRSQYLNISYILSIFYFRFFYWHDFRNIVAQLVLLCNIRF